MADSVQSPNMLMPVPVVGVDPGPQYAIDIDSCLNIIDQHNHASGSGVKITPDGLNINADLTLNNNNLIATKSVRFQIQPSALAGVSDLGCLYEVGVDLYYNDGLGNQVRITQSGAVAGTPGSIANLTSPASASYVGASETFVWQSDVNKPANLDAGYIILRNNSVSSNGLTLFPPSAMGADYSLTLPALPIAANAFVTINPTGAMASTIAPDGTSIAFSGTVLQIPTSGVTTIKIADANVTRPKLVAVGQQVSASSGAFDSTSNSYTPVTNLTGTITTTGRPVQIMFIPDGTGNDAYIGGDDSSSSTVSILYRIKRDTTVIAVVRVQSEHTGSSLARIAIPPAALNTIDVVGAGTYTYTVEVITFTSADNSHTYYTKMVVYEL